jgi:predicted phage terminase large subunit-like protein
VWRDRAKFPELLRVAKDAYDWYRPGAVLIEDASAGTQIIQTFQETALPIIAVPALGSKLSRAEAITPLFESGRVVLPKSAPWLDEWIEEHLAFPDGEHDDQVDTTSMALARLSKEPPRPFSLRV